MARYGWDAFEHHIVALADTREQLLDIEVRAILGAGGNRTRFTYNLSPGGEVGPETGKPIVGVYLSAGEVHNFDHGKAAAKELGFSSPDMPNAVARGQLTSIHGWWFKFADDATAKPPEIWGEEHRASRVLERRGRSDSGHQL